MANSCLGLYIDDNYVKYAKVIKNNSGIVEIDTQGMLFVNDNLNEIITNIIKDTNSKDSIIASNISKVKYSKLKIFKQANSSYIKNIVNLEYESWCERFSYPNESGIYVYNITDAAVGDYKYGSLAVVDRDLLEERANIIKSKNLQVYPEELIINNIVSKSNNNYMLINLDKNMYLRVVNNDETIYESLYDSSMSEVFERFSAILGGFSKAYEASKAINVFNDSSEESEYSQLEDILEPILREALQSVTEDIKKYKSNINKLYITGSCTLFTNIDTLMTEFFGMKCEVLIPEIIYREEKVKNITDVIEYTPAIALAKVAILNEEKSLNYMNKFVKKSLDFSVVTNFVKEFIENLKKKKPKKKVKPVVKKAPKENIFSTFNNPILGKVLGYTAYALIVTTVILSVYMVYTNMYMNAINKEKGNLQALLTDVNEEKSKINTDINTINTEMRKYKQINNDIDSQIELIENEQLLAPKTYKVASFMQEIIRIIPSNVELVSISSDDNKKITMVATAEKYEMLGYFIASIKVQPDLLKNVEVEEIVNDEPIKIQIGGDLP